MAGWGNVEDYSSSENINPCLVLPVSYIEFAKEETRLFRLLFINHMDLRSQRISIRRQAMKRGKRYFRMPNNIRQEPYRKNGCKHADTATDGCALLIREAIDKMDDETFKLYLKYHYATCERKDLTGITSHAIDIFQK